MELTAFERFYVMRYKDGKSVLPQFLPKVLEYIEWEKEQESKNK